MKLNTWTISLITCSELNQDNELKAGFDIEELKKIYSNSWSWKIMWIYDPNELSNMEYIERNQ